MINSKDGSKNIRRVQDYLSFAPLALRYPMLFLRRSVILGNLLRLLVLKTAELPVVSLNFPIRWRKWTFYYYKIGVCGGKEGEAVGRAGDVGGKEERVRRPSWGLGLIRGSDAQCLAWAVATFHIIYLIFIQKCIAYTI